jgi:A nuclease of the HNH/ENDO VII superfamily with conserved LHH
VAGGETTTSGCRACDRGLDERKGQHWGGAASGGWQSPTDPGAQRSSEGHSFQPAYVPELGLGLASGLSQNLVPFGANLPFPKGTPAFELGRGVGQMLGGLVQMAEGLGMIFGGGAASTTGVGALVGVPALVEGVLFAGSGALAIGAGASTLLDALNANNSFHSTPSDGAGPGGPPTPASGPGRGGKKIPNSELVAPPRERGLAPTGKDGKPVELHHNGQRPDSPLDEMTATDHRGAGNFSRNHSNTGQSPSKIDRGAWKKEQRKILGARVGRWQIR